MIFIYFLNFSEEIKILRSLIFIFRLDVVLFDALHRTILPWVLLNFCLSRYNFSSFPFQRTHVSLRVVVWIESHDSVSSSLLTMQRRLCPSFQARTMNLVIVILFRSIHYVTCFAGRECPLRDRGFPDNWSIGFPSRKILLLWQSVVCSASHAPHDEFTLLLVRCTCIFFLCARLWCKWADAAASTLSPAEEGNWILAYRLKPRGAAGCSALFPKLSLSLLLAFCFFFPFSLQLCFVRISTTREAVFLFCFQRKEHTRVSFNRTFFGFPLFLVKMFKGLNKVCERKTVNNRL